MTHRPWRCCEELSGIGQILPNLRIAPWGFGRGVHLKLAVLSEHFFAIKVMNPNTWSLGANQHTCKIPIFFSFCGLVSVRSAANCGLFCCSDCLFFTVFFMTPAIFFEKVCMLSEFCLQYPSQNLRCNPIFLKQVANMCVWKYFTPAFFRTVPHPCQSRRSSCRHYFESSSGLPCPHNSCLCVAAHRGCRAHLLPCMPLPLRAGSPGRFGSLACPCQHLTWMIGIVQLYLAVCFGGISFYRHLISFDRLSWDQINTCMTKNVRHYTKF